MSRSYQQKNQNNLNNQIGSIAKQKQDMSNNVDTALGTLSTQFDADVMGVTATNAATASAEQTQNNQWKVGVEANRSNALIQNAIAMLKAKMITKDQARAMTGLDL